MDNVFEDNEQLLRAVLPSAMFWKDNRLSSAAFKDPKGLSVDRVYKRKMESAVKKMTQSFIGSIISVKVSDCRDVQACVKYLPSKNKYHSEIHRDESIPLLTSFQAKHLARVAVIEFSYAISTT